MKSDLKHTASAIMTSLGEGGIGVVLVAGPKAVQIVEQVFRPTKPRDLRSAAEGRLCHGFVCDDDGPIDEVILRICPRAALVEINCHGGIAAVRRVHDLVVRRGAPSAPPEDLLAAATRRDLDEIQREALALLPQALTKLAVRMLIRQYNGALSSRLSEIENAPAGEALGGLDGLLGAAAFGIGLCTPRQIVVAGKPNVGKSTLVNALLREERVIVHHLPGTTRDAIGEAAELHGIPFELVDTAGIRQARDEIEMIGVAESRRQIGTADIILLVLDLSAAIEQEDRDLLDMAARRDTIVVANKADRPPAWDAAELGDVRVFPLSALTGGGLDRLEAEIVARCGGGTHRPEEPTPFTERQRALLASARQAVANAEAEAARGLLRRCLQAP